MKQGSKLAKMSGRSLTNQRLKIGYVSRVFRNCVFRIKNLQFCSICKRMFHVTEVIENAPQCLETNNESKISKVHPSKQSQQFLSKKEVFVNFLADNAPILNNSLGMAWATAGDALNHLENAIPSHEISYNCWRWGPQVSGNAEGLQYGESSAKRLLLICWWLFIHD